MGDSLEATVGSMGSDPPPSVVDAESVSIMDYDGFTNYIRKAVTILLPEEDVVPVPLNAALDDSSNQECIRKFLSDPQTQALYIQRSCFKDDENEPPTEGEEEKDAVAYYISNDVHFTNQRMASLVCIKRGAVIEADKSIHSQLRLINFSEGSPYETLHSFISKTLAPYFKSYVKESGRADRDGDKMAPSVEKKLAELEMGLLHLQQNIDIPEVTLNINSTVIQVVKKCADEGRKAKITDFGDRVEDSTFLNTLQNGVNR